MSNPEPTQDASNSKPRGKVSAFFHEHGGTVAAVAGLAAALITVFVVTRGGGGGSSATPANPSSTTPTNPTGTGTGASGSGSASSPVDLSGLTSSLTSIANTEAAIQQELGQLISSGSSQGTPVTRPTPPTPPDQRPVLPAPLPVGGGRQSNPIMPTNLGTTNTVVRHPNAVVTVTAPKTPPNRSSPGAGSAITTGVAGGRQVKV